MANGWLTADKDWRLWVFNLKEKKARQIDTSQVEPFSDLAWSPDSQWLAYVRVADNTYPQIWLYSLKTGSATALTTDRVNSFSPVWSPDGKWIYFLSERHLESAVPSPWGLREPEPYFDSPVGLYHVSLLKDQRSPFEPSDELHMPDKEKKKGAGGYQCSAGRHDRFGWHSRPRRTRPRAARQLQRPRHEREALVPPRQRLRPGRARRISRSAFWKLPM